MATAILRLTTGVVYARSISGDLVFNSGSIQLPDGTAGAPSLTFASDTDTGIFRNGSDDIHITAGGTSRLRIVNGPFGWAAQGTEAFTLGANTGAPDVVLARDAANTLAQRNGTNAQIFRVYNTYTNGSNYELGTVGWSGNVFLVGTDSAGTGSNRALGLRAAGSTRWTISTSGHFLAEADNTYDIGASGATRPRTGYFGTSISSPLYTAPSGNLTIQSANASNVIISATGAAAMSLRTNGSERWIITSDGHLTAATDNTYDIGANSATRPRTIYAATSVISGVVRGTDYVQGDNSIITGTSGTFSFGGGGGRTELLSSADGNLRIENNAGTNTFDITLDDAKTTLSAEGISVAVDGTINLGAAPKGMILVSVAEDNDSAIYALRGGATPTEVSDPSGIFTNTKDSATSINIYYDTDGYYLQNKRGGSRTVRLVLIGA